MKKFIQVVENVVEKISSNVYLQSISKGMVATITFTMVGSVLGLIKFLPFEFEFLNNVIDLGLQFTSNFLAFWAIFNVSGNLSLSFGKKHIETGIISILSYLILLPVSKEGHLNLMWLGPRGTVSGIVLALITARLYVMLDNFLGKYLNNECALFEVKKMIVSILTFTVGSAILRNLIALTAYEYYVILISKTILIPLQLIGGTLPGILISVAILNIFFLYGIHGATIVMPFMSPVWVSFGVDNLLAKASGEIPPNIIETGLFRVYSDVGGASSMLGLVLCMFLFSKSNKYKEGVKKFSIPTMLSVGEPLMYGLPLISNKKFIVPMVLGPVVSVTIAYFAIYTGLVPRLAGITIPNGIPVFIDAFLAGGIRHMFLQAAIIVVTAAIYFPFFKADDRAELAKDKIV